MEKFFASQMTQREMSSLERPTEALRNILAGEVEDMARPIEEDVGFRALPLFDELLAAADPTHHRELLAVEYMRPGLKVHRHTEIMRQERGFAVDVHEPEHAMCLAIESLPGVAFVLGNR